MYKSSDRVKIKNVELLSNNWYLLHKINFEFKRNDGSWQTLSREVYDRGNGAAILLYNSKQNTVVLTRQFRIPAYVNDHPGMLIEACAGLLDKDDPETCIRQETKEETGYTVHNVRNILELFMSPGSVTERLHFFVGEYQIIDKNSNNDDFESEEEDIEVLEITFPEAVRMIGRGEIMDGKMIILLQYAQLVGLLEP